MAFSRPGPAFKEAAPPKYRVTGYGPNEDIRIVLIGKTGNGKSSSGNTILNRLVFRSLCSAGSVTSECSKARGVVHGCRVAVIDTPGIYDTKYTEAELGRKLKECISLSAPGPHVFLIVVKLGKFTEEEQKTVQFLSQVFGERAAAYSMVLFTHGDQLRGTTIQEYISGSEQLCDLLSSCSWRYHVFSNTFYNHCQLGQLLAKIKKMISDNGGSYYTNPAYQGAEEAIQKQAKRIMEVNEEQRHREEERLRTRLVGEQLQKRIEELEAEYKRKSREKAEKKNKFVNPAMVVATAEAGVAIGLAATAVGGPLCMGVGAVVGGVTGALVGLLAPGAGKALKEKCTIQ
ncbi:GTPase IMAP family member 4-like [Cololabis saira]|uniref:GTPase IMAP family member 4-like n=1 Tax=Cololabis saira TaxID=129043 RepID=UPI002AD587FB|nr:GTPase IMAP family member 4-like [Cololabis saira]